MVALNTKLQKHSASGSCYLFVNEEIVQEFLAKGQKRALAIFKDKTELHCAFLRQKTGEYYIMIGQSVCKKMKVKEGDELEVKFLEDNSEFQFEMPEEFAEVLLQDFEADSIFQNLTDGNKRGLIYLVTNVKSSDKRIEKAMKIVEKLKLGVTSPRLMLK
jgi:Bacteriocin-protection, YdeI or OmpD-Associated/Domain of unknown function (DUF1905)